MVCILPFPLHGLFRCPSRHSGKVHPSKAQEKAFRLPALSQTSLLPRPIQVFGVEAQHMLSVVHRDIWQVTLALIAMGRQMETLTGFANSCQQSLFSQLPTETANPSQAVRGLMPTVATVWLGPNTSNISRSFLNQWLSLQSTKANTITLQNQYRRVMDGEIGLGRTKQKK